MCNHLLLTGFLLGVALVFLFFDHVLLLHEEIFYRLGVVVLFLAEV